MPQFKYLMFLTFLVCGCKSSSSKDEKIDISGNWVLKEVIEQTYQSGSIRIASQLTDFYCTELIIDSSKDSLSMYNGLEGFTRLPIAKIGEDYTFKPYNKLQATLFYDSKDSSLFFADSTMNRVYRFFKAKEDFINKAFEDKVAFPSYINNAIVEGKWRLSLDSTIEFSRFGEVKNWSKYTNYTIQVNGALAEKNTADMIILNAGDIVHLYGMRRNKEKLFLFDLKTTPQGNYENSKVLFELTKVQD